MSALEKIAFYQNRRDESPNQELAMELVKNNDQKGISEIAENLENADQRIQSDCLKVLYEIGFINPALIASHADRFISLLDSRNNRLVWGALIGLSTIAELQSAAIGRHVEKIKALMATGSVITVDNGVKTLAIVASREPPLREQIVGYLLEHLKSCRPKDVPQHSERALLAVDGRSKSRFVKTLEARLGELSASQLKRVQKVISQAKRI